MPKFTYKSNCQSKSLFLPFATDTNDCATRADAIRFMRNLEKELVSIIEQTTDCTANYYIFGDKKIIGQAYMYDNATLMTEALAYHSPYYNQIDLVGHEGLSRHYLTQDCHNDKRNHIIKK